VITSTREFDVPNSLEVVQGLDGCTIDGTCTFRGDVIRDFPDGDQRCVDATCKYDGEGRTTGYVVPREDETPVTLHVPGVTKGAAKSARLVFAATYPWFDWNGVSKPPTAITLSYRVNGGSFHDRPITDVEATAFTDFSPDLGGAGHGAGNLNQVVDLDLSEIKDGDNTIELMSKGTWTGDYRAAVNGVTLLLDD
jgi:hypothetical protein